MRGGQEVNDTDIDSSDIGSSLGSPNISDDDGESRQSGNVSDTVC